MKRSAQVAAPLLASAALAMFAGCRKPEMQRCVDESNHVVADSFCQQGAGQRRPDGHGGFLFIPNPYRFYYGGYGGYGLGSVVGGGGYSAAPGRSYAPASSGTSRGGFGSTLSSHGGGEGGGGE